MPLSEKEDIFQELAHITAAEEAKQRPSVAGPSVAQRASGREGGSKNR
jgi:hypothetical protein